MTEIDIYIEFLKWCLKPDADNIPACVSEINWHKLKDFAKEQTIVGIYWYGIQQGIRMTDDDVLDWMSTVAAIQKRNKKMFSRCVEITEFFEKAGFKTCILKGQGNALMYPDPSLRTSGDIDIWVDGGRKRIVEFMCKHKKPGEVVYHHADFPIFDGVEVEVHFMPTYFENPFSDYAFHKLTAKLFANEQFTNRVSIPDGTGQFSMPTIEFNLFYQLMHLHKHLRTEGIGLRHLVDYYYLLKAAHKQNFNNQSELNKILQRFCLTKFAGAVMYIMKNVLGLDEQFLFVQADEEEGKFLLDVILTGGNFGKYDERVKEIHKEGNSHFMNYFKREQFRMRLFKRYPSEVIWAPFHDLYVHYAIIKRYKRKYNL